MPPIESCAHGVEEPMPILPDDSIVSADVDVVANVVGLDVEM